MYLMWQLFWVFFKIGSFTLGSGLAMIPQIKKELVSRYKWLNEDEFIDILAVCQSSPGPILTNLATFLGLRIGGFKGMVATLSGSIFPSFIIILAIAFLFEGIQNNPMFIAAFQAVKPASVALILIPVISMAKNAGATGFKFFIPVGVAALITFAHLSPIYVILGFSAGGILFYGWKNK